MSSQTSRPRRKAPAMHECARCGRRRHREDLIRSRHTGRFYCGPRYMDAYAKRAKKKVV